MKNILALSALVSLCLSNIHGMHRIDEAIATTNIEWVKNILSENQIDLDQKQLFLEAANDVVNDCQHRAKSLFRSHRDMLRLLFGLGVNGCGCMVALCGLIGLGVFPKSSLGVVATGGIAWTFGLYNFVKGWKMSSAYGKLNKARQIQQLIRDFKPHEIKHKRFKK